MSAQTQRTLDAGTRVRVRLDRPPVRMVGLIAELRPDTIVLSRPETRFDSWTPLAVANIAELEVSGGRRRLTVVGVGVGVVSGLVLTAAYNGVVQSQCFNGCPEPFSRGIGAALGGVALGAAFYFLKVERWSQIALPRRNPVR